MYDINEIRRENARIAEEIRQTRAMQEKWAEKYQAALGVCLLLALGLALAAWLLL